MKNKVALIDDNKFTRIIYEDIIDQLNAETIIFKINDKIEEIIKNHKINGLILNEDCKHFDIKQIFNYIKENKLLNDIPVVITSSARKNRTNKGLNWLSKGAFEYIQRRAKMDYIKRSLKGMLNYSGITNINSNTTEKNDKNKESYISAISSHLIVVIDKNHEIIHCNEKAINILFDKNPSSDRKNTNNFFDFIYNDDNLKGALINTLKLLISAKKTKFEFETSLEIIDDTEDDFDFDDWDDDDEFQDSENESEESTSEKENQQKEKTIKTRSITINWGISLSYNSKDEIEHLLLIGTDISEKARLEADNQEMAIDIKLKNLELVDINHQLEEQNDKLNVLNQKNELLQAIIRLYTPRSTWTRANISIERGEIEIPQEEVELTMVFGDIQNFTKFSEKHTALETINSLNELFQSVTDYVYYFDGDIDKFVGDAFFAVFADPKNAVLASSKLNMALDELNDNRMMEGKSPLFVRIGINTGTVIRGNVGGRERKDNTLIGDAVNTAQRLEGLSIPGQILISEKTYEAVKDMIITGDPVDLKLKGKKQNIVGYYIEGLKDEYLELINVNIDNEIYESIEGNNNNSTEEIITEEIEEDGSLIMNTEDMNTEDMNTEDMNTEDMNTEDMNTEENKKVSEPLTV